jgi:hypothetical protein
VNPSTGGASRSPGLEWTADLTFERDGRIAARLRSNEGGCVLEIVGRRGLLALRQLSLNQWRTNAPEVPIARLASLMPEKVDLSLRDILIGCYEPSGVLNWWSRRLGLPFGRVTIDKLAFARAFLLGGC